MEMLLDTTVQIERIFKREKREQIEKIIEEHNCGSSTYVFGEYKRNMVRDFVTLYNIMCTEDTLAGVREHIDDTVFHRSFQRVYYIYNDICKLYNEDFALIKENLKLYARHLERRFQYGIEKELLNETDCHRAKARIQFRDGKAELPGVSCSKRDDFCKSCEFFEKHKEKFARLKEENKLPEKMRNAITKMLEENEPLKGNTCKTVGDCMIALEALDTTGKLVCTTNGKDFRPICTSVGVGLWEVEKE